MSRRKENLGYGMIEALQNTGILLPDEMEETFYYALNYPEKLPEMFFGYYRILKDIFELREDEIKIIKQANARLERPHRSIADFLEVMEPYKDEILETVGHMGELNNETNREGLNELMTRMKNASEKKRESPEWAPKDGDPFSDKVIWGFTRRENDSDPITEIHLMICHAMERTLTPLFEDIEDTSEFVSKKDWLFAGLTDVIILKGLRGEGWENEVFDKWREKRPNGLGWISDDRIAAYKEVMGLG